MKKINRKQSNKNSMKRSSSDVNVEALTSVKLTNEKSDTEQHASTMAAVESTELKIDKLRLAINVPTSQIEVVDARLKRLVASNELKRNKQNKDPYRHAYHVQFADKSTAVILLGPQNKSHSTMILILNPAHVTKDAVAQLIAVFRKMFPLGAKDMVRSMKFARIDVAGDFPQAIDELIVDLEGSVVAGRILYRTGGTGQLQTQYMGDVNSAHHGIAYDQDAADEFKVQVGEIPSRVSMEDAAELLMTVKKGRMRLEHRHLFSPPITYQEFAELSTVFGKYKIYKLKPRRGFTMNLEFLGYVECVRLRGVAGARKYLTAQATQKKVMKERIDDFEHQLSRMAVEWFKPQDMNAKLLDLLQKTPVWRFLKPMAGASR